MSSNRPTTGPNPRGPLELRTVCPEHGKPIKFLCIGEHSSERSVALCSKCLTLDRHHTSTHGNHIVELEDFFDGYITQPKGKAPAPIDEETKARVAEVQASREAASAALKEEATLVEGEFRSLETFLLSLLDDAHNEVVQVLRDGLANVRGRTEEAVVRSDEAGRTISSHLDNLRRTLMTLDRNNNFRELSRFLAGVVSRDMRELKLQAESVNDHLTAATRAASERPRYSADLLAKCGLDEFIRKLKDLTEGFFQRVVHAMYQRNSAPPELHQTDLARNVSFGEEKQSVGQEEARPSPSLTIWKGRMEEGDAISPRTPFFITKEVHRNESQPGKRTTSVRKALEDAELALLKGRRGSTTNESVIRRQKGVRSPSSSERVQSSMTMNQTTTFWPEGSVIKAKLVSPTSGTADGMLTGRRSNPVPDETPFPGDFPPTGVHLEDSDPGRFSDLRHEKIVETDHNEGILCLALVGRNAVATGSADSTIKVWDIESYTLIGTAKGHTAGVRCMRHVSRQEEPSLVLVSAGEDKTVIIWNAAVLSEMEIIAKLTGHTGGILDILVLPNLGNFVTAGKDHSLRLWGIGEGAELRVLKKHFGSVTTMALLKGGYRFVSAGVDQTLQVWVIQYNLIGQSRRVDRVVHEKTLDVGHDDAILVMVASQRDENILITAGLDSIVKIWNISSGKVVRSVKGHARPVLAIALVERPAGEPGATGGTADHRILAGNFGLFSVSKDRTVKYWMNKREKRLSAGNPLNTKSGATLSAAAVQMFSLPAANGEMTPKMVVCLDGDVRFNVFTLG